MIGLNANFFLLFISVIDSLVYPDLCMGHREMGNEGKYNVDD